MAPPRFAGSASERFRDKSGSFAPNVYSAQRGSAGVRLDPSRFKRNIYTPGLYGSGIGIQGLREARGMLLAIGGRLEDPAGMASVVFPMLEREYVKRFDRWYPRMYDTGDLRHSLTEEHANGAIREIHLDSIDFGTSIPYAKFHWRKLLAHSPGLDDRIVTALAAYYVPFGRGGGGHGDSLSSSLGGYGARIMARLELEDDGEES